MAELQLPHYEKALIKAFFFEPILRETMLKQVYPKLFSQQALGILISNIKDAHAKKQPFTLEFFLGKTKDKISPLDVIESIGGKNEYLGKNEPKMIEFMIDEMKASLFTRMAFALDKNLIEALSKGDFKGVMRTTEKLRWAHDAIFRKENKLTDPFTSSAEEVNSPEEYIQVAKQFPALKAKIGGWTRGDISSIGGKSGHNKTTFTLYEAIEGLKSGFCDKLLYFSIDEPREMIARRIIASQLDISLSGMRNKTIKLDVKDIEKAMSIFKDRVIILDDVFTPDAMVEAMMDVKPRRVIVDHIQEVDYGEEGITDAKVMVACGKLKRASKLLDCNTTVISQVRDKLIDERFDDKIPRPHDFLYASDLRRKSREQCVVYWQFKDTQEEIIMPYFAFIVWKSTYSETGRVKMMIDPDKAVFAEIESSKSALDKPKSEEDIWKTVARM